MLRNCLKSCSEEDIYGVMRFHLPHARTTLSPVIDLPGPQVSLCSMAGAKVIDAAERCLRPQPRLAGFYSTPPGSRNDALDALHQCVPANAASFGGRMLKFRQRRLEAMRWNRFHWTRWKLGSPSHLQKTPRVPHLFTKVTPADATPHCWNRCDAQPFRLNIALRSVRRSPVQAELPLLSKFLSRLGFGTSTISSLAKNASTS